MKIVIPVIDFGDVTIENSPDNNGHIRVTIEDSVGGHYAHADLDVKESYDLMRAVEFVRNQS